MIADALQSREGQLYTAGAAVAFLLTAALATAGVDAYGRQWALREAAQAAAQGSGDAPRLLRALRAETPSDPTPRVLLAAYEYRRARDLPALDTARLLFEEALELDRSRTSAIVGLLATRLRMAALKEPEARARDALEVAGLAEDLAREAYQPQHPDLLTVRAGALLLAGRPADALALVEERTPGGLLPSRDGAGARAHTLAAARILARRAGAIAPATRAFMLRWTDPPTDRPAAPREDAEGAPGRLLALAYQVDLADPRVEPADREAVAQRAAAAAALLPRRVSARGPQPATLPRAASSSATNALGIAWYRVQRYAEARAAFDEAVQRSSSDDPVYLLNLAQAAYRAGLAAPDGSPERGEALDEAIKAYRRLGDEVAGQEGREGTLVLAMTNAAAIALQAGDPRRACNVYGRFLERHPSEVIRTRNMAVLDDHAGRERDAARGYRRAIELRHPDTERLQRRLSEIGG